MSVTRKTHLVLIARDDGSVAMHAMKEWLRQNPEYVPPGCDATSSTSQQLRAGLKKQGWLLQETDREFRLIPPGTQRGEGSVLNEVLEADEPAEDTVEEASFALEYQLRDFLAQNIGTIQIAGRRLHVYVDPTGRDGIEYPSAVGPIDLLALDSDGDFFVFELKRGRTPDHTIGQLTRYMGWVTQTIGQGKRVNGVIVAKSISDTLRYAVCIIPNVSLFEYEVSFHLHAATQLGTARTDGPDELRVQQER